MQHLRPEALRKHVVDVAAAFNIKLSFDESLRPEDAAALHLPALEIVGTTDGSVGINLVKMKLAICRPVVDETSYAVTLHELGHLIAPNGSLPAEHAQARSMDRHLAIQLVEEQAAWEWAVHQAMEWTPVMQSVMDYAIGTYQKGHDAYKANEVKRNRAIGRNAATLTGFFKNAAAKRRS